MPSINKEAFIRKITGKPTEDYGAIPGAEMEESASGELSCGEQLVKALGLDVDPGPVDAALREAVSKYGNGG